MASVRKRVSKAGETSYAVLFRIGGQQRSRTFQPAPGKRPDKYATDFAALVDILGGDKALATLAAQTESGLTVDDLAQQFFAWKAANVTPRTLTDYRRDYDNWIKPRLGSRHCSSLDERDVQSFVDEIAKELHPKSVADRHMLLHSMFKFGVARTRRLVDYNPCTETSLPKRGKRVAKGATHAEFHALHEAAKVVDPDAADLILFIAGTGWRWSEAAALPVRNVDDDVPMRVVMSRVFRRDGSYRLAIAEDEAKSQAGLRLTKVSALPAAAVRRRIVGRGPDDLVFTSSTGRQWHQQNFLSRTWPKIEAVAGLDRHLTPHALRHLHVALLDRAGATPSQMQRRVGHEDIKTTLNVYGGMIDDITDDVLGNLDTFLVSPIAVGEVVTPDVIRGELT